MDVGEITPSVHHLLINRVVLLGPTAHFRLDLGLTQVILDRVNDRVHESFALGRTGFHQGLNLHVELRLQHGKREVLQLPFQGLDTQPVR